MSMPFPFDLAWPTSGYVALYLVTLLTHALFMSYVLGGALAVAFVRLHGVRENGPVTRTFIDWLPFALSAAITAGVAPLLFVQILYQREFYTANLLSFHRWMAILPVLIGAFYLLYLLKARPHARRLSAAVASASRCGRRRWAAAVGTMTGFGLIPHAVMGTVAVVIANVLLRPVAKSINRQPVAEPDEGYGYDVEAICRAHDESQVRFLLLQAVNNSPLTLQALHSADIDGSPMVRVSAQLEGAEKQHALLEQIVARLSMEAGVSAVSWKVRENETTA